MGSTVGQLHDRQAGSLVMGSPIGRQLGDGVAATQYMSPPTSWCVSGSPLALASSNLSQQDSGLSETLLLKTGSFTNSASSQAMNTAFHAQCAQSPSASQLGCRDSSQPMLRQLLSSSNVQTNPMLRQHAQLASLTQYPFAASAPPAYPPLPFPPPPFPLTYAMGIPTGIPAELVSQAQPSALSAADSLAQLLAQHPQRGQPIPSNNFGPSINFDLDRMAMALEMQGSGLPSSLHSTSSNVSLSSELLQSCPVQGIAEMPSGMGHYQASDMSMGHEPFISPLQTIDLLPSPMSQLDREMLSREFDAELTEQLIQDAAKYPMGTSPFFSSVAQQAKDVPDATNSAGHVDQRVRKITVLVATPYQYHAWPGQWCAFRS